MKNRFSAVSVITFAFSVLFSSQVFSQESWQLRRLVDAHTAGVLSRGSYEFDCGIYPAGNPDLGTGINFGIGVGVTNRLMIGISYGGEGFVGRGKDAKGNSMPGFLVKYRIFEENYFFPGVVLGYDHQGHGGSSDTIHFDYKGYIYKSPGFFLALSKNYLLFTKIQLGLHGAATFSMEEVQTVKWPNAYAGMDLGINDELSLVCEYNLGLNTRDPRSGKTPYYARLSEGYLNLGLKWAFSPNFFVEFDAKDVLENRKRKNGSTVGWCRELRLVYINQF
ncbi:MAG: hypothetical protein GX556_00850 [Fibrobacter sp.]|nr:hypothetical protein [Fibrobacter sp.]